MANYNVSIAYASKKVRECTQDKQPPVELVCFFVNYFN